MIPVLGGSIMDSLNREDFMTLGGMIFGLVLAAQDPDEVETLRKEVERLRDRVTQLEQQAAEDAALILRLRQALQALERSAGSAGAAEPAASAKPSAQGPQQVIRGRVDYVEPKMGFLLVNVGEPDGVRAGFRFEILREEPAGPGAAPRLTKLGTAVFEKFMGEERRMSKLKVIEGQASQMRDGDEAVAIRDTETPLAPPPARTPGPAAKPGVYRITGRAGTGFVVNYGAADGARQSQVVMAYKDGKLKAKLRLDMVERTFSVAQVIDGTEVLPVEEDDTIYTAELQKTAIGKIRVNDEKKGIFVDVGQNNFGIKVGDRLEVRRHGQKVGVLRIIMADKFHSWARPDGDTRREDLQVNDTVELLPER